MGHMIWRGLLHHLHSVDLPKRIIVLATNHIHEEPQTDQGAIDAGGGMTVGKQVAAVILRVL